MDKRRIIVVGGGPAGMMAAIRAAQLKQDVTLIEKNHALGRKLLLSGKGRCNLTNACDPDSFLKRFSNNGSFLRDAFKIFFSRELIDFFQKRGLRLKIERQKRVFPATDRAKSILDILEAELHRTNVTIIYNGQLKAITFEGRKIRGLILTNNKQLNADRIILATGGISYSATGSTGEGLYIAEKLGHHIVPLLPGLVPLKTEHDSTGHLEGLTLRNIRLKFSNGKSQIITDIGELLFTNFGISGPLVLSLSGKIADWLTDAKEVWVELDLKPALSNEQLEKRIIRECGLHPNTSIKNMLKSLMPVRMVELILRCAAIPAVKHTNQLSQQERKRLTALLKGFRIDITGPMPIEDAMITRGGVSLKDIDPRTMESRIIKGLYFAGEMIDIDADTGGFNLQAAFSTGYLAGESASLSSFSR